MHILEVVLLSGYVVFWEACDWDALKPRDLFLKRKNAVPIEWCGSASSPGSDS
jgi:hypothetical protein